MESPAPDPQPPSEPGVFSKHYFSIDDLHTVLFKIFILSVSYHEITNVESPPQLLRKENVNSRAYRNGCLWGEICLCNIYDENCKCAENVIFNRTRRYRSWAARMEKRDNSFRYVTVSIESRCTQ